MTRSTKHSRGSRALALLLVPIFGCSSDGPAEPRVLDLSSLVVTPAHGEVGAVTEIVVSAQDTEGRPWTGGLALSGEVSGANAGATVTSGDLGGGDYAVRYTPSALGFDTVTILNGASELAGGRVPSRVRIVYRAQAGTATADGVVSPGEWDTATAYPVFSGALAGSTARFLSDGTNIYVAVTVPESDTRTVAFVFLFDNLIDFETNGDDRVGVNNFGSSDQHFDSDDRIASDTVQHGSGLVVSENGTTVAEIARPLDSGDPQDISLAPGGRVGICFRVFASFVTEAPEGTQPWPCGQNRDRQELFAELILPE